MPFTTWWIVYLTNQLLIILRDVRGISNQLMKMRQKYAGEVNDMPLQGEIAAASSKSYSAPVSDSRRKSSLHQQQRPLFMWHSVAKCPHPSGACQVCCQYLVLYCGIRVVFAARVAGVAVRSIFAIIAERMGDGLVPIACIIVGDVHCCVIRVILDAMIGPLGVVDGCTVCIET